MELSNQQKTLNALGLAIKAQKVVYGERLLEAIRHEKVFFVLISSDMGSTQKKKLVDKATSFAIAFDDSSFTIKELNEIFNRRFQISAIGITDGNLAKLIKSYR